MSCGATNDQFPAIPSIISEFGTEYVISNITMEDNWNLERGGQRLDNVFILFQACILL